MIRRMLVCPLIVILLSSFLMVGVMVGDDQKELVVSPSVVITAPPYGATATNPQLIVSGYASDETDINYWDNPPDTPSQPEGPTEGGVGETLFYETVTTDPDGDSLEYMIDWGDGTNTGWLGPIASGYPFQTFHAWYEPGTYEVKAKARDIPYHAESDWSEPLIVTIYGEDTTPPVVTIYEPEDGATFTEPNITVIGTAEDNVGIVSIGSHHEWEDGDAWTSSTIDPRL